MKNKVKFFSSCLLAAFLIPLFITLILSGIGLEEEKIGLAISAALTGNGAGKSTVTMSYSVGTEEMDTEEYIAGVLAPAYEYCSHKEFLKAMAVLCRTYVKYCNLNGISCTAKFYTDSELENRWGSSYLEKKNIIEEAVAATTGEYIRSGDITIYPYSHMLTSGYTRNKEENLIYLCEVGSSEDSLAEEFVTIVSLTNKEFITRIKSQYRDISIDEDAPVTEIQIISKTQGGYVLDIQIGNLVTKGDSIAELLGLPSASFTVKETNEGMIFTIKGKGSGYGLSIYGAAKKAENGSGYKEILNFYYKNIQIETS